jgi:2-succinyl-5-enolpyruvyl-6-hydroxy-3-cyclohexene-1-carboxylate synthase
VLNLTQDLSERTDVKWIQNWSKLDDQAQKAFQSVKLHAESYTDYAAVEGLLGRIPPEYSVFLSNSMIPRDVAILQSRFGKRQFLVNRGAAGIDGITSTAVGCAVGLKKPLALLTGDLAFLHDVGALALQSHLETPLLIGVIQNRGGTIFRKLPVYSTIEKERFRHYFETPQEVDIESLCKAYNVSYRRITQEQELSKLTFPDSPGIHVVELITDPDASHNQREELLDSAFRLFLDSLDSQTGVNQLLDKDAHQELSPIEVTIRYSNNGDET